MTGAAVTLTLSENDYLYGVGTVTIRVRLVHREREINYDDDTWYEVDGVQLGFDGRELGLRTLLVRASRVR
jgi:hypothetical protein